MRYLVQLAFHEAKQPPRFPKRRYEIQVECHFCDDSLQVVKGAVEAMEFICRHNKHSTYVKAVTLNGEVMPEVASRNVPKARRDRAKQA